MHFVYVEKEGTTRYLRNKGNTYGPGQTEDYYEWVETYEPHLFETYEAAKAALDAHARLYPTPSRGAVVYTEREDV